MFVCLFARATPTGTRDTQTGKCYGKKWLGDCCCWMCWVRVIGKSTSFGQELLPTLLTQHQQQQERPTLPNAQDRFLLPVHRVWWSGLFVCLVCLRARLTCTTLTLTVSTHLLTVLRVSHQEGSTRCYTDR